MYRQVGQGIYTDATGWAHIYNLPQGKFGIQAVPPAGSGWVQTSTIEGTHIIDAWVKPNEPEFFAEFGPPGPHVFIGFVKEGPGHPGRHADLAARWSTCTCRGRRTTPFTTAPASPTPPPGWASMTATDQLIYAAPTDGDCNFNIPGLPDGNYQLVIWDSALDLIISTTAINIAGGQCNTPSGSCNLGEVPVFQWFHRSEQWVFNDDNANGMWDPGEIPLPDVPLNIRWRDGTIYQTNVTDTEGAFAFDEVFPFFSLAGGRDRLHPAAGDRRDGHRGQRRRHSGCHRRDLPRQRHDLRRPAQPAGSDEPVHGLWHPTSPCIETVTHRVETGPVLLEAFQGFIGQTNTFQWGKRHYPDGENGGITGVVFYDVTRAENNPELAAAEVWEPGIPGVTVNCIRARPGQVPNTGDDVLLNTTVTDSWDASIPTGCK